MKDLEYQLGDFHEAAANVKAQQQKLIKIPEMERKIEVLHREVEKLR